MLNPSIGRWMEEDPIDFKAGDADKYRYAGNDPTNDTDPSGLASEPMKTVLTAKEYEDAFGLTPDIQPGGRMAKLKAYLEGDKDSAFIAQDCLGVKGCTVSFKFEKAYIGKFKYTATKSPADKIVQGLYINLAASLDQTKLPNKFAEIKLLQLVFRYSVFGGMKFPQAGNATENERSRFRDEKAPSRGWMIDRMTRSRSPYFDSYNGRAGGAGKPAFEMDLPSGGVTAKAEGVDIYTLLIGLNKEKKGVPIAYLHWGFYIDDNSKIAPIPAKPEAKPGYPRPPAVPTAILNDAVARWNNVAGGKFDKLDLDLSK
jgi:hypothetical protein